MLGWCILTPPSARLKASVRFPPLRGMYQRRGTCKGCDSENDAEDMMSVFGDAPENTAPGAIDCNVGMSTISTRVQG